MTSLPVRWIEPHLAISRHKKENHNKEDGFVEDVSFLTSAAAAGLYFKMNLNFKTSQHIFKVS
jgi:hypothetical protein